jgi:hypothetical protein
MICIKHSILYLKRVLGTGSKGIDVDMLAILGSCVKNVMQVACLTCSILVRMQLASSYQVAISKLKAEIAL